jgi:hypothetical protein
MSSLGHNNIGTAGARDLGAALQVNTTLMTLMCGSGCWFEGRCAGVSESQSPNYSRLQGHTCIADICV